MPQARGELTKLLFQYQTAARTAPAPAAKVLPFTSYSIGRDPKRQANGTMNNSPLGNKTDPGNPIVPGQLQSIFDLRTIGYLLKLLLGQPVTTGAGPYVHTFPVNLDDRPYALLELAQYDISKFNRTLDAHLNKLAWDVTNNDQNITADFLAGEEIDPIPTVVFDAAPTSVVSFRACSASGVISDGAGSTLGQVVDGKIEINNNMAPLELANGVPGYSIFPVGELMFSGSIKCVFDGASAWELARAGTSTRLKMVSAATIGANTFSLAVDMPYVELMEKTVPKAGRSGLFAELSWKAVTGATLPTVVLTNDVVSY
ncbi:MAG: hypothetical protein B7Y56_03415 [Gallionellales bacterium 35-53-114]|jgi:hypothetical protein|nr:MAG: hypothetical protein B7Y56_03415 [Gallionellales bacterium 35-53-114]OYZ65154.1 MAG: hypothetical protein B7Y04_00575 [Gallionellales bacterium 24-53-125]OZB08062.1 MAG: hypothetical protein B7X61_11025 [Gallionellales bacterium 39-52-133]HQS59966.1 phage tail tube protein [Gallionellaceae bacterium]HQS76652.1 phage tail tube protein [Gallionellaceae bacterium]